MNKRKISRTFKNLYSLVKETGPQRARCGGWLRKRLEGRVYGDTNKKMAGSGIDARRGSQLGPRFMLLPVCSQAETVHGARTQQHPRGPGVGTLRTADWSADCRLPHPSRKGDGQDGPLQSGDR